MTHTELLRADLRLLADLVPEGSRVLDVGCGDGALLAYLRDVRGCEVRGIEISEAGVVGCIARGIPVLQADLDEGLRDVRDHAFDVVVVAQTLQEVRNLKQLLSEVLRVGRKAIVSYPNFGQLSARLRLGLRGRMPVSKTLPYQWYDTPNVHYTTLKDFHTLIDECGAVVENQIALRVRDGHAERVTWAPNLRAELAVATVARGQGR